MENSKGKKRMGLGRGLGALLSDSKGLVSDNLKNPEVDLPSNEILISQIETNPFQPRTTFDKDSLNELASSIRLQGIIQPITVRKIGQDKYQLISGERRFQASQLADLKAIPAYIREANDQQMLEMAIIENIQRENLNAIEIAQSYNRLMIECNFKQEELGEVVGKDRTTINNYLRLLKLPILIQDGLKEKKLSMGHARAILGVENKLEQEKIYNKIISEDLSVRKVEELVRKISEKQPKKAIKPKKANDISELTDIQNKLGNWFGSKVLIKSDANVKGEIKIPFGSKSELELIIDKLK